MKRELVAEPQIKYPTLNIFNICVHLSGQQNPNTPQFNPRNRMRLTTTIFWYWVFKELRIIIKENAHYIAVFFFVPNKKKIQWHSFEFESKDLNFMSSICMLIYFIYYNI